MYDYYLVENNNNNQSVGGNGNCVNGLTLLYSSLK